MKQAVHHTSASGFGRCVDVFVTAFTLVFAPCLPALPGIGMRQARANQQITDPVSTRVVESGNVTVETGGNLEVTVAAGTNQGGGAHIGEKFVVHPGGAVKLTYNNAIGSNGGGLSAATSIDLTGASHIFFGNQAPYREQPATAVPSIPVGM